MNSLCVWYFQIQIYICHELVCLAFQDSNASIMNPFCVCYFRIQICICQESCVYLVSEDSDTLPWILCMWFQDSDTLAMNSVRVISGFRHVSITAPTGTPAGRGVPHARQLRTFVRETCGPCGTGHSAVSIHWDWRRVGTAVDLWWRLQWPGFFCLRNWCESWCCIFLCCKLINTVLNVHRNHKAY